MRGDARKRRAEHVKATGYARNHEGRGLKTLSLTAYEAEGVKALLNHYSTNPQSIPVLIAHPFTTAQARRLSSSL